MKQTLWIRNFNLLISATTLGAIGGIAGSFALSFLVFDETGSTLASALTIALQLIPSTLIPILVAPWMDRLPRKKFLVAGDVCNGIIYTLLGIWLLYFEFSYIGYLAVSLALACVSAVSVFKCCNDACGSTTYRCSGYSGNSNVSRVYVFGSCIDRELS